MYERFYELRERPFALSPDPDYLYRSRVHSEALSYLRYGIEGHAAFIVITGEVGSGKTTLLQAALRGVDRHTAVARLVNTQLDARDLIEAVMLDFGLAPENGMSKPRLLRVLAEYLVQQRIAGRLALLVVDEAQNLSRAALEEIRMLSNLETEKSKLIQIVLVGQPELRAIMARPELEQLRQRVTVSYHLPALDVDETAAYVNHRLARAAAGTPMVFPREVTDVIHQYSRGIPRRINVIADAVLLYGYGEGQRTIDLELTRKAIDELQSSGILTPDAPSPPAEIPATPSPMAAAADLAAGAQAETRGPEHGTALATTALIELVARQERLVATLQHMLTEQNHALQLHREQMAALIDEAHRAASPPPSTPQAGGTAARTQPATAPAIAAPDPRIAHEQHATSAGQTHAADRVSVPVQPTRATQGSDADLAGTASTRPAHSGRPWPPPDWPGPARSERLLVPPLSTPPRQGWWSRFGRGVASTFSFATKE